MKKKANFRTARGYQLQLRGEKALTPSMEDYLEMIYRNCRQEGFTRVSVLATSLNVQAPSASRMVQKLTGLGLLNSERYGIIRLTESGKALGKFLLRRHQVVEEFLALLGLTHSRLTETEMIEHSISLTTLERIAALNDFFQANPEIYSRFQEHSGEKP